MRSMQRFRDTFALRLDFYFGPMLTTLGCLAFSLYLHLYHCCVYMTATHERWATVINLHKTFYPFSIRYLTTYPVLWANGLFGLPLRTGFFVLQFLLFFLLGLAFYRFLMTLGFSRFWSNLGVALCLLSYPVLLAHSEPAFTYDDFWMYLFLTLCFTAVIESRFRDAAIWFALGCFAREPMLLYTPAFALGLWHFRQERTWRQLLPPLIVPLSVYGLFLWAVWQAPHPHRWELFDYNFENYLRGTDSLYSAFIAFGFIWVIFLLTSFWYVARRFRGFRREEQFLIQAGGYAAVITLVAGLCFTLARETHVFYPPFVFLVPLAVYWFREVDRRLVQPLPIEAFLLLVIACEGLLWPGLKLGNYLLPDFEYHDCRSLSRALGGIHLGLGMAMVLLGLAMTAGAAITALTRRRTPDRVIR